MAKTCIICGGPAGSGEHVFPAALGGRRTNKGIYCATHDNGYSSLVGKLAEQLALFNSLLGVVPDHGNEVKSVQTLDQESGQIVKLSAKGSSFTSPYLLFEESVENGNMVSVSFPDKKSAEKWVEEQKAQGNDIAITGKVRRQKYFLGTSHKRIEFGGPHGLAAVAYVAQTFLAQEFPELTRSSALDCFKKYTQEAAEESKNNSNGSVITQGDNFVWWDFNSTEIQGLGDNAFEFGHRVTVGIDASDGLIYGRISFFSSLNFAIIFGTAIDSVSTKIVTVDIDPLAKYPPNDIKKYERNTVVSRVSRPPSQFSELSDVINNGTGEKIISALIKRLVDYGLKVTAEEMYNEILVAATDSLDKRRKIFSDILEKRSQRVWNLASYVVKEFKASLHGAKLPKNWVQGLDGLVAHDPTQSNGLSVEATNSFNLAHKALLEQFLNDYDQGILDVRRISELMGEGPGMAIVGKVILDGYLYSKSRY